MRHLYRGLGTLVCKRMQPRTLATGHDYSHHIVAVDG